jgi:acetoin utilization deacetylase AcuC-like enzyme
MHIFHYDHAMLPLPSRHRFPAGKYALLLKRVAAAQLSPEAEMVVPSAASHAQLSRAHDAYYLHRVQHGLLNDAEIRRIGLPWSPELATRVKFSVGATIAACRSAVLDGYGLTLGGGTHHACHAEGQGFCVYNDVAVAARSMQAEGRVERVVVIDCDVHQGNGTAEITQDDPTIFTFSIHGEKNFPFRKIPGNLDIGLPDGTGDADYLTALERGLETALRQSRADLAIYLAGADVHENDRLGRLSLTKHGIEERDRLVFTRCREAGTVQIVVEFAS